MTGERTTVLVADDQRVVREGLTMVLGLMPGVEVVGSARELDTETSLTIYRVAQEALTNIRRHATPDRVEVSLSYDPGGTRLTVRDHAQRPSAAKLPGRRDRGGYGLTGMRERAELLGGSLRADHTPDGFCVELWIPA